MRKKQQDTVNEMSDQLEQLQKVKQRSVEPLTRLLLLSMSMAIFSLLLSNLVV